MNWFEKPKEKDPPLRFIFKGNEWKHGQWPIHHSWNDEWDKASYHNEIDDGTDDDEVLDL